MEAILNIIAGLGLVGSLALLGWGMGLCLRHGLGEYAYGREPGRAHGARGSFAEPPAHSVPGL
jgi:hypothetical protein